MNYIFGLNILADKLRAMNARHRGRWMRLASPTFDWKGTKGTPRPTATYRAQRREDQKALRREQKRL
jgi:hypothetical protein